LYRSPEYQEPAFIPVGNFVKIFHHIIFVAGIVFICFPLFANSHEIFVSPAGNDTNTGARDTPFQTLNRACETAATTKTNDSIIITLSGGIYKLDKPLSLTSKNSGSINAPFVIRGMAGNGVVLCGGVELKTALSQPCNKQDIAAGIDRQYISKIRKWKFEDIGISDTGFWSMANMYKSIIPQLFYNDKRMVLARWPNDSFARIDSVLVTAPIISRNRVIGDSVGRFICRTIPQIQKWAKEIDHAFLHGYWFWDWYDNVELFDSINTESTVIKTQMLYNPYGYRKSQRFYAANLLCELDREGEWCVDPKQKLIYFWPLANSKKETAWLTIYTGGLVSLKGVSHISFIGLEFMASVNGLVTGTACTTITFERCVFRNTGGNGITLLNASNCSIEDCEFAQIGKTAIAVSGGVRKTLTPSNIRIVNNRIHDFGQVKRTCEPAVRIWDDAVSVYVGNNTMFDAPHTAIMFMGNNHVIENNHIYNVCTETQDAGVIYAGRDWTARGTVIRNNFIENCGSGDVSAVYLDDMTSGIVVEKNRIKNVPRALKIVGGRDNVLCNNTIIDTREWLVALKWSLENRVTLFSRLSAVPYKDSVWSAAYPALVHILDDDPGCPKGNVIKGNILVNAGKSSIAPEISRYGVVDSNFTRDSVEVDTARYGVR
jgi:hypothetical protein